MLSASKVSLPRIIRGRRSVLPDAKMIILTSTERLRGFAFKKTIKIFSTTLSSLRNSIRERFVNEF